MARVVVDDLRFRIVQDVVILLRKIARGRGRNDGFNFADGDFLDAGIRGESAGGNSGAKSDSENRFRIGMKQRGKVPDHALQFHIVGFGGGFHVAVDVNFDGAVVPLSDGDGGIYSFDGMQNLRCGDLAEIHAAVGDHSPGIGSRFHARKQERASEAAASATVSDFGDIRTCTERERTQRSRGRDEQNIAGFLRADAGNQNQADAEGADNGSEGVGSIDAADDAAGILTRAVLRRPRASGKTRAPENSGRKDSPRGSGPDRAGKCATGWW